MDGLEALHLRVGRAATPRPARRRPGRLRLVAAGVALLAGAGAWRWVARPAPLEQRMPLAAATTSSSPPAGDHADPPGRDRSEAVVHVVGAVLAPGVVRVRADARVIDAVAAAGGLAPGADTARVNLAAPVLDGSRIVVPSVGEPVPAEVPVDGVPVAGAPAAGTPAAAPVELNSATAEQLDALPGIGPATAEAILAYRRAHGPFSTVDDLLDVRGIGEAKLEALRDLVVVR